MQRTPVVCINSTGVLAMNLAARQSRLYNIPEARMKIYIAALLFSLSTGIAHAAILTDMGVRAALRTCTTDLDCMDIGCQNVSWSICRDAMCIRASGTCGTPRCKPPGAGCVRVCLRLYAMHDTRCLCYFIRPFRPIEHLRTLAKTVYTTLIPPKFYKISHPPRLMNERDEYGVFWLR